MNKFIQNILENCMNKFSASKIHILGHMFLFRRKSRGEADGCTFCQKGFREAVLRTVIPWCKLTSISPHQHFCDTASALPAGLRASFSVLHTLKHHQCVPWETSPPGCGQEEILPEPRCWNTLHTTCGITWPRTLPQRHPAGRFVHEVFPLLYTETKAVVSKAWDICLISVFLRLGRSQHSKMKQMNKTKVMYWFLHSLAVTRFHSFACWINAEI